MKGKALIVKELNEGQYELVKIKRINLTQDVFRYKDKSFVIKPELFIYRKGNTFFYMYEINNPNPLTHINNNKSIMNTSELDSLINTKIFRSLVSKIGVFDLFSIIMLIVTFIAGFGIGFIVTTYFPPLHPIVPTDATSTHTVNSSVLHK